ncbi:MAG: alpha/beta hydrolase [Desulfatitalea sp.]|nr:alpha/beta hydrolase [Desulfatitalea sp.]
MISVLLAAPPALAQRIHAEHVILLHGLARTERSLSTLENHLKAKGYKVLNVGYPSRHNPIEVLAETVISSGIERCRNNGAVRIHFITHSLGGILVRYYLAHHDIPELGRVVMLAPPNGGSEVVDKLGKCPPFRWLNGPAGDQLGTDRGSIPRTLGPVDFDLGVIAGDRSINLFLSFLIPGRDDGKVSIENTKVDGMSDFTVVHTSHPFIMKNRRAIDQAIVFLQKGRFD